MVNSTIAKHIADLFHFHDAICSNDSNEGLIVSERDYLSNLGTHIRYPYGSVLSGNIVKFPAVTFPRLIRPFYCVTLKGTVEQRIGCDGIIVFRTESQNGNKTQYNYKVGLYETKFPDFHKENIKGSKDFSKKYVLNGKFDETRPEYYLRKDTGNKISRFSNQLCRQHKLTNRFPQLTLWEQFFCKKKLSYSDSFFWNKDLPALFTMTCTNTIQTT